MSTLIELRGNYVKSHRMDSRDGGPSISFRVIIVRTSIVTVIQSKVGVFGFLLVRSYKTID